MSNIRACINCGEEFPVLAFFSAVKLCQDCILLHYGTIRLEGTVSVSTWWKPQTWGRTEKVVTWDAESAKKRVAERIKARSASAPCTGAA